MPPGSTAYVEMAALLALMVGLMRVVIGLLRFGAIAYFMSLPVLRGFTSGAAVLIMASQVPSVLGIDPGRRAVWSAAWNALREPVAWNLGAVALALLTLVLVRGSRRISPLIPGTLLAVVAGIALSHWLGNLGPLVGEMPSMLPFPSLDFRWARAADLALGAAVIAIVGFAEPAAIARTFAERSRPWNADRELVAQGIANVVSGLVRGFPVGGSFGRSALGRQAGARTRLSGAVAGLAVLAFFPFAGVLETLPRSVLGAIVMTAAWSLLDLRSLFRLWRVARLQATTALGTFVLTLVLAPRVDYAVILGISLALFTHLYREAQLEAFTCRYHGWRYALDGRLRSATDFGKSAGFDPRQYGLFPIRVETWRGLVFVNLDLAAAALAELISPLARRWTDDQSMLPLVERLPRALEKVLNRIENQLAGVSCVVVDATHLGRIDFSALMMLHDLETRLRLRGLDVRLEGMHGRSERIMERIRRG